MNGKYKKIAIYKIYCIDSSINNLYIGSTTDFDRRKSVHKFRCNTETDKYHNYKIYKMIRETGGWDKYKVEIIQLLENTNDLKKIEREYIEKFKPSMNSIIPGRTMEEYRQTEKYKTYVKNFQKTDKFKKCVRNYQRGEKFKNYQKQYRLKKKVEKLFSQLEQLIKSK